MKKSATISQKIVIKIGSSLLTGGRTKIVPENLERLVSLIVGCHRDGHKVILVTSGAVASGLEVLGFKRRPAALSELQAAAAQVLVLLGIMAAQTVTAVVAEHLVMRARLLPADLQATLRP